MNLAMHFFKVGCKFCREIVNCSHEIVPKMMQPKTANRDLSLERAKSDQLVADIDFDDLESRLEKMEKKSQTDNIEKTKNEIFDPARYQVMNKLITADAITNVVQLEHRLKDERYMVYKKTRFRP